MTIMMCSHNGINPLVMNGVSHYYHLDESTSIFRGIRIKFSFLFSFSIKLQKANKIAPDGTPRSHILGYSVYLCPNKKDAMLIWVKNT